MDICCSGTPLQISWRFPDISAVKATIHFAETGRLHPSEQNAASAQADLNERILLRIPLLPTPPNRLHCEHPPHVLPLVRRRLRSTQRWNSPADTRR